MKAIDTFHWCHLFLGYPSFNSLAVELKLTCLSIATSILVVLFLRNQKHTHMYLVVTCLQHVVTLKEKHKNKMKLQQFLGVPGKLCVFLVACPFLMSPYRDGTIHLSLCLSIDLAKHEIHPSVWFWHRWLGSAKLCFTHNRTHLHRNFWFVPD